MNRQILVDKGRTIILPISFGYDISQDTITSQIRVDKDSTSELIATWTFSFETDGTDGEGILTLDDSVTSGIEKTSGWMDIKRVSGGEPFKVFDEPIEVIFKSTVTV